MFTKDQIRYLSERPWLGALRQDANAAKGNVYMPGSYVLAQLNRAFGFEGWSYTILEARETHFGPTKTKSGADSWRLCYFVRVKLFVTTPVGRIVEREGCGADEATSPNLQDVWQKAPASALTHALKGAAITFGPQFGLGTVRAAKGPGGVKADWRAKCQEHHPRAPNLYDAPVPDAAPVVDDDEGEVLEVDGVQYDARTGVEIPASAPVRAPQEHPVLPPQQYPAVPAAPPPPATHQPPTAAFAPPPQNPVLPLTPTPETEPSEVRRGLVQACRALFRDVGAARGQQVFADVAKAFGFAGPMADLGRADGGASVDMLRAFEAALRGAR